MNKQFVDVDECEGEGRVGMRVVVMVVDVTRTLKEVMR